MLGKYNAEMKQEIVESYFEIHGINPTIETAIQIAKQLPREIYTLARQWGWNDTEVRDKVYRFIKYKFNKN